MAKQPEKIDYHRPTPHPDRWQWRRIMDVLIGGCFAGAIYCGVVSYVFSHRAPRLFEIPTIYVALGLGAVGVALVSVSKRV